MLGEEFEEKLKSMFKLYIYIYISYTCTLQFCLPVSWVTKIFNRQFLEYILLPKKTIFKK